MSYQEYVNQLVTMVENEMNQPSKEWVISERLSEKITQDGKMKPFYGATSVIKLSNEDIAKCREIQQRIMEPHGDMFVRLYPETFHVTIHAFSNAYTVSPDVREINEDIQKIQCDIEREFILISQAHRDKMINMRSIGVSTGGRDVVSLKFVPDSMEDYRVIMNLFDRFEDIYPLGKPYVPHVSLGYFKLKRFAPNEVQGLYHTLHQINQHLKLSIKLDIKQLVYQHHFHMNHFKDIFRVAQFL